MKTPDDRSQYIPRVRENVPAQLLGVAAWLLWRWPEKDRKIPYYASGFARNGKMDAAEDRAQLVEFEAAATAFLADSSYYGLGLALGDVPGEEMQLAGIDLDDVCHDEAIDARATQILNAANSYAERSPSLTGIKIFGLGAIGTTGKVSDDGAGLEIYDGKRFFAVTGLRLNGAHIGDLTEAATLARALFKVADKKKPPPAHERYSDGTEDVGAIALANLEKWVPALLPTAQLRPDGTWRATAKSLGRDTEEDLVCAPGGCMDYGASPSTSKENAGRSPVQLVMDHNYCEFQHAMDWLRVRLHLPPFRPKIGGNTEAPPPNDPDDPGPSESFREPNREKHFGKRVPDPVEITDIAELRAVMARPVEGREWFFEEIIPAGAFLIVGRPKVGKSWLLFQLALAAASCRDFLSFHALGKFGVLYISAEDDVTRIKSRLHRFEVDPPSGFRTIVRNDLEALIKTYAAQMSFAEWLDGYLAKFKDVKLVIIDTESTVKHMWDGENGGSQERSITRKDYAEVREFDTIALKHSVFIGLVNHTGKRKNGQWFDIHELINRTNTALAGASGSIVIADPPEHDPMDSDSRIRVLGIRGRDINAEYLLAIEQTKSGAFESLGKWMSYSQTAIEQQICDALIGLFDEEENQNAEHWYTSRDVADCLGKSAGAVQRAITRWKKKNARLEFKGYKFLTKQARGIRVFK